MLTQRLNPNEWIKTYDNTKLINIRLGDSIEYFRSNYSEHFSFRKANNETPYCIICKDVESLKKCPIISANKCIDMDYFDYLKRIFINGWDYSDMIMN